MNINNGSTTRRLSNATKYPLHEFRSNLGIPAFPSLLRDKLPGKHRRHPNSVLKAVENNIPCNLFNVMSKAINEGSGCQFAKLPHPDTLKHPKLFFIAGSNKLASLERTFQNNEKGLEEPVTTGAVALGMFRKVVTELAALKGCRNVLVDCSPSGGILNKIIVTSCDAVISPCFGDYFSFASVQGLLTEVYPQWMNWVDKIHKDENLKRLAHYFEDSTSKIRDDYLRSFRTPMILPFLLTTYSIYEITTAKIDSCSSLVTKEPTRWIKSLNHFIMSTKVTQNIRDLYVPFGIDMILPILKDMNQFIEISHVLGKGIGAMTASDIKPASFFQIKCVRARYQQLAHYISYAGKCILLRSSSDIEARKRLKPVVQIDTTELERDGNIILEHRKQELAKKRLKNPKKPRTRVGKKKGDAKIEGSELDMIIKQTVQTNGETNIDEKSDEKTDSMKHKEEEEKKAYAEDFFLY